MAETHLQVGDPAPPFTALDEKGQERSLSDYRGKKLVLFIYPKDNTPGCTAEACSLRDHFGELQAQGYELLGVSADSAKKHQNFINKYELPFPLLADIDKQVIQSYGAWGMKKFMGREFEGILRTTFIIDENGRIEAIFKKVKTKTHAAQILESAS